VLVIFGLTHGYWMANMLPRQQRLPHYWLHSLVFVYFALLLLLRIVWRLSEPTPVQPQESAGWEKFSAHLGHLALYALTIAVTVTGYMNWSAFPARGQGPFAPNHDALRRWNGDGRRVAARLPRRRHPTPGSLLRSPRGVAVCP